MWGNLNNGAVRGHYLLADIKAMILCLTGETVGVSRIVRQYNPISNSSLASPKIRKNFFTPIEKRRALEAVSDKIKGLVFDGTLKVGNKLPSETDLANQFKVGRQTIREALRPLELSGFIAIKKGGEGGPTISNTILHTISDLFLDAIRMRTVSIP